MITAADYSHNEISYRLREAASSDIGKANPSNKLLKDALGVKGTWREAYFYLANIIGDCVPPDAYWIDQPLLGNKRSCSHCGMTFEKPDPYNDDDVWDYCPSCGAFIVTREQYEEDRVWKTKTPHR